MHGKTFRYLYDFGDAWEHSVRIEGIAPADTSSSYPRLIEATARARPRTLEGHGATPKRWRPLATLDMNIMSKLSKSLARATIRIPRPT
jgi:hypothetical protein